MNAVAYCLMHGLKVAGPDHPAILCADETLSYGALAARVSQFAAGLRAADVRPGDRVAMLMLDTPDIVALHLGAMAAGAVAVALSSRASADELAQILAVVRPAVVMVVAEFEDAVARAIAVASPETELMRREHELTAWKAGPVPALVPELRRPDDAAFWVMTSGTTGQPKAVEHRHANVEICAQYYEQVLGCTHRDRLFATSRFHFAYAIGNMFAALRMGATNILLEHWATAPSVAETVERFKPTVLLSVPAVYHRLLDAGLAPMPAFRALRHYVSAGERLPPQIWNAWEAAGGHPILDGLGCSELVYMVIGNTPQRQRPGSSGQAMPSVELRIVDESGALISEANKSGRLEVRMPSVCSGYRSAGGRPAAPPQRPVERFRPGGWFATGDEYLRDADGFYHHRGRTGDMLRVSGIWISPAEIEDALAGIPSLVESAAVLGENKIGLAEIVLFVVPAAGADGAAAVAAARERLSQALPSYKQPRRFEIVADLPRTATGKIQRHKLRERLRGDLR
jgi:acyl-coenzyme A synthetase/AMP-(fatty) acid ligase